MELQLRRIRYVSVPNSQNMAIADAAHSKGVILFKIKINSLSKNVHMSISLEASPPSKRR